MDDIQSDLLSDYQMKKDIREKRIRNRKKRLTQNANPQQGKYTASDENINAWHDDDDNV